MLLSVVMSALLVTAAGCGNAKDTSGSGGTSDKGGDTEKKSYKIAISQIVEHPSLDAIREGFLAALKDAGISEADNNLRVDTNNAQGDQANNISIAQKMAADNNDLILAIATPSAQAIVKQEKETPILFAGVTDPLNAKLVSNLEKPGGNVSGVADMNPKAVTDLMGFIAENFPNVKKLGLVLNTGESNAVLMASKAEEALKPHGITLVKAAVTNTSEIKQATESLVGRVDALYITLDNIVVSGADTIIQVANAKHIPFFSSDRDTVEKGAFATVGFKYYDHGYQAGKMAVEVLKDGKNLGDMEVKMQEKLDLILNLKAAKAQGITVTDAMKEKVQDKDNDIIE